jgi:hypothetical protein
MRLGTLNTLSAPRPQRRPRRDAADLELLAEGETSGSALLLYAHCVPVMPPPSAPRPGRKGSYSSQRSRMAEKNWGRKWWSAPAPRIAP